MARSVRRPRTKTLALGTAAAVLTTASLAGPFTERSEAGGHIDAPSQLEDSPTDLTDVYAFTSPDDEDKVTFIANVRPFQLPGTPDKALADYPFANGARYEIHTDADGDGAPDISYRWTFSEDDHRPFGAGPKVGPTPVRSLDDASLRVRQTYTLERVIHEGGSERTEKLVDGVAAPTNVGRPLMPDYPALRREAIEELPGGGKALAGQSAESFKANTQAFGLYTVGTAGPVPQWGPDATPLAALNVNSLVIQVPKKQVALAGDVDRNPVVGVWSSVSRPGADLSRSLSAQAPSYRQVSRQGTPHVAFALFGTTVGLYRPGGPEDRLQLRTPADDPAAKEFQDAALDPVPPRRMDRANAGYTRPKAPREDIQALLMKGIGKDNGSDFGYDLNTHTLNQDADPARMVLAEELRINLTTPVSPSPKAEGVVAGDKQGFPNGRRINDNADNALIRMLAGEPRRGDGSSLVPEPVLDLQPQDAKNTFPYLNPPHGL
ncbi:hypothetical protein N566_19775 [Streptomycetaceae bacterium MP113-05]|nr:hypothetical protein N566_19775 [Streptomycetaceae bacterium MP113-05]